MFIGHGRSQIWRELKDHLQDLHGYKVEAYEVGARAGHVVRDILGSMLDSSSFALLVMTAEDEMADGTFQPRMNVVHELGLFQGRLGWRGIMLLEEVQSRILEHIAVRADKILQRELRSLSMSWQP